MQTKLHPIRLLALAAVLIMLSAMMALPASVSASGATGSGTNEIRLNGSSSPNVPSEPTTNGQQSTKSADAASNDWVRILVVVMLLLAVAGGFYALSRSFNDEAAVIGDEPTRKRGRPRKNPAAPAQPKRPRGRPRKS